MALTKSGQVPLAAAGHVLADAARLAVAALAEAAGRAGVPGRRAQFVRLGPAAGAVRDHDQRQKPLTKCMTAVLVR